MHRSWEWMGKGDFSIFSHFFWIIVIFNLFFLFCFSHATLLLLHWKQNEASYNHHSLTYSVQLRIQTLDIKRYVENSKNTVYTVILSFWLLKAKSMLMKTSWSLLRMTCQVMFSISMKFCRFITITKRGKRVVVLLMGVQLRSAMIM